MNLSKTELIEKCMDIIQKKNENNENIPIGYVGHEFLIEIYSNLTEDNLEESVQILIDEAHKIFNIMNDNQ